MIFFLVSQELFDDVQHLRAHAGTYDVVDVFMTSLPVSPAVVYDDNDDDVADRSSNVNAGPMPT